MKKSLLVLGLLGYAAVSAQADSKSWLSPFSASTATFSVPLQPMQGIFPAPPPIQLHKELIPKNITIVRCYYEQQIMAPNTTFGFDINGAGFTQAFQNMITVNIDEVDVQVKNLRLVTANQIHGEIEVGPEALTAFIYPRVYIQHLPVFTAPEPFGVVRPNEVLYIAMMSVDDTGLSGRYRVITNLAENTVKQFHVEPTTPGLELGNMEPDLPFRINGTMLLSERVPTGRYGLVAYLGKREIYRESELVQIVHPNVGTTGLIKDVTALDPFQRPGQTFSLLIKGSSFAPSQAALLKVEISGPNVTVSSATYLSAGQMTCSVSLPPDAKEGFYNVKILGPHGTTLLQKKNVFTIVPSNWVGYVRVDPEIHPGGAALLKIVGRDFSDDFAKSIQLQLDDPGIHVGPIQRADSNTLTASFKVDPTVAAGDYLVTLTSNDKPITPVGTRIIKVLP